MLRKASGFSLYISGISISSPFPNPTFDLWYCTQNYTQINRCWESSQPWPNHETTTTTLHMLIQCRRTLGLDHEFFDLCSLSNRLPYRHYLVYHPQLALWWPQILIVASNTDEILWVPGVALSYRVPPSHNIEVWVVLFTHSQCTTSESWDNFQRLNNETDCFTVLELYSF